MLMLLYVAPPFVETCHWYPVMVPDATTLNDVASPKQAEEFAG